jgi:glycosyltransferase involved in cell wall biosynthesis
MDGVSATVNYATERAKVEFPAGLAPEELVRTVEQAGCGIAVPPEDPEAFVKAIRALAETPEEADKMGAAGRAFVEDWASPQAVARAYEALFTRLRETVGSVS